MSTHDEPPVPPPDRDDPRWLAYLLGELADAERAELEAILARSPEARAHLEEVREVVGALERELGGAPAPSLGETDRGAIRQAAARPRRLRRGVAVLVACSIAIPMAAGVMFFVVFSGNRKRTADPSSVAAARRSGEYCSTCDFVDQSFVPRGTSSSQGNIGILVPRVTGDGADGVRTRPGHTPADPDPGSTTGSAGCCCRRCVLLPAQRSPARLCWRRWWSKAAR